MNGRLKLPLLIAPALFLLSPPLAGRVYTSVDGKRIEAEYVSVSDTHVTLKLKRDGRDYTFPLERLSQADQDHVAELRESIESQEREEAARASRIAAAEAAAEAIAQFAKDNLGKKVGNGECWTLADHAFKAAGVRRPGSDGRVWGRELDWTEEMARPGDILELESARFPGSKSGPNHTAVIIECKRKGIVTVCHQNVGGRKTVSTKEYDLKSLISGKAKIFRYE